MRVLSKFYSLPKMSFFAIFIVKFFDHMLTYPFKIYRSIWAKTFNFFQENRFRKKFNRYNSVTVGCKNLRHYLG